MPSLKLSNPFRRSADRSTLKQRAADLKAGLGHHAETHQPTPEQGQPGAGEHRCSTVEEAASLDFTACAFDTPTHDPNGWMPGTWWRAHRRF